MELDDLEIKIIQKYYLRSSIINWFKFICPYYVLRYNNLAQHRGTLFFVLLQTLCKNVLFKK